MDKSLKKDYILLAILWIGSLLFLIDELRFGASIDATNYRKWIGLIIITICTPFVLKKPTWLFILLFFTLALWTIGLVSFSHIYSAEIYFIFIRFNPIGLVFFLIFLFKRKAMAKELYYKYIGEKKAEVSREALDQNYIMKTNRFKTKFQNISDAEIERRLQTDLVDEAKEALLTIKAERENK